MNYTASISKGELEAVWYFFWKVLKGDEDT